jgi:hypothetical protein
MEDIDDEIEIRSRPTKSKPRPTNEEPRSMKLAEKVDRKKTTNHPSPPKEIRGISVIKRRDHQSSVMGSRLDEHRASQVQQRIQLDESTITEY